MNKINDFLPVISMWSTEQKKQITKKLNKKLETNYESIMEGFVKSKHFRDKIMDEIKDNYDLLMDPYKNVKTINYKPTSIEKTVILVTNESYESVPNRKSEFNDFKYLKSVSNKYMAVYRNNSIFQDTIIISYRGTKEAKDIVPDYFIAKNKHDLSNRFIKAIVKYDELKEKYPKATFYVTGHSLGGALAIWVQKNRKSCKQCYAFNPGYNGYYKANLNLRDDKIKIFIVKGDIICNTMLSLDKSMLPTKKNLIILEGTKSLLQNHKMNNFIKLI